MSTSLGNETDRFPTDARNSGAERTGVATDMSAALRSGRKRFLGRILLILLSCGLGGGLYVAARKSGSPLDNAKVLTYLEGRFSRKQEPPAAPLEIPPRTAWDGLIGVTRAQAESIGLKVIDVEAQTRPIKLELTGRTAYNPNSLYKVRPRFDTLVEKVLAEPGQLIHKGDPLVELFSTELASAKNEFQTKYVQWQHDLRLLRLREKLAGSAVAQQLVVDSQNEENKSRLEYMTARDKFRVLGVPESEIEPLISNLGDFTGDTGEIIAASSDKAKMTLRALVEGIVIQREVVPGNLYDEKDVLMVIAPLDRLWVLANVYEVDQSKVAVGQRMEIRFPFLQQAILGTVDFVASEVSRETRAVQIRTSIPNEGGKLKADMLVKAILEIPPTKGQTHIPRLAMVVINGNEYVFVKKKQPTPDENRFERRKVTVVQENSDFVVVADGIQAGEQLASGGSLILAQLYEDLQMVDTSMPVQ